MTGNRPEFKGVASKRLNTRQDTEKMKDFGRAMDSLVKNNHQTGRTAMLPDQGVDHAVRNSYLTQRSHMNSQLKREQIFDQVKKENILRAREEAAYNELESCTF